MSIKKIKGQSINYEISGTTGKSVILLHGWGQNVEMMRPISDHLAQRFVVYNLDLPGFGLSDDLKEAWTIYDYADFLEEFCDVFKIKNPILICHSFGARIGIIFASRNEVNKMVITGGAGIKDKHGLDYYLKVYSYKLAKKTLTVLHLNSLKTKLMNNAGSSDYKNANGPLKETFVKVVNEDLSYLLKKIKCETLLVWGENDQATPLWMGKKMEKEIPNAGLAIFENDDHFAYFNEMPRFLTVLDVFLRGN